ncbi:MAG TPA: glutamine amidotransferase [Rhizomicrobium sp.]|jgi:GMP synthase (glutamine-hydrolysing)
MTRQLWAIRHVAFEDMGTFALPLIEAGYDIHYLDAGVDDLAAIDPAAPELMCVLGGPIGAYDETLYPFVADEIALLKTRLAAGRPTLGLCLGAQMMARALGAAVYKGRAREIGFLPLTLTEAGRDGLLAGYDDVPVLHWHGDVFDLPAGAERLASTPDCDNQAFALGNYGLGFQCHPEAQPEGFERWLVGHACELAGAGLSPVSLRRDMEQHGLRLKALGQAMLRNWLAKLD